MDENNDQWPILRQFCRPIIIFLITRWEHHMFMEQFLPQILGIFLSWAEVSDLRSLLSCLCFASLFEMSFRIQWPKGLNWTVDTCFIFPG